MNLTPCEKHDLDLRRYRAERDAAVADLSAEKARFASMSAQRDIALRDLAELARAATDVLDAMTYADEETARRILMSNLAKLARETGRAR
jgi:hypothetical protein